MNALVRALYSHFLKRRMVISAIFCYALLLVLWRTYKLALSGEGSYQQADWLINYSGGFVRRGAGGEAILFLSDRSGIDPLMLTGAIVALLTIAIFGAILICVWRIEMTDRLFLAFLSPAFLLFWANDFVGAHRKELLGFAAFLPLLVPAAAEKVSHLLRLLVVAIFGIAVTFHEANVFLAPILTAAVLVRFSGQNRTNALMAAGLFLLAGLAAAFALRFASIESADPVCERILAYGLSVELCGGVFQWLEGGVSQGVKSSADLLETASILAVLIPMGICIAPVVVLLGSLRLSKMETLAVGFGALAIIPLFFVAIDWGRWISFATFGLTFVALIRAAQPAPYRYHTALPNGAFTLAVTVLLGVGIGHVAASPIGGFVYTVVASLANVAL